MSTDRRPEPTAIVIFGAAGDFSDQATFAALGSLGGVLAAYLLFMQDRAHQQERRR